MKIFLICPVRNVTDEEQESIRVYVTDLEKQGVEVHWPERDTDQLGDDIGYRICNDNRQAITDANEVHVWWNEESKGSYFDLGMAFALHHDVVLANRRAVVRTDGKSFENFLRYLDHKTQGDKP